jgi:hypothetical protein
MSIHFLSTHIIIILNLYTCSRKQIFTRYTTMHKYLHRVGEILYLWEIKHLNQIFFLFPCMSINFFATHILAILNLCTCSRKLIFYAEYRIA